MQTLGQWATRPAPFHPPPALSQKLECDCVDVFPFSKQVDCKGTDTVAPVQVHYTDTLYSCRYTLQVQVQEHCTGTEVQVHYTVTLYRYRGTGTLYCYTVQVEVHCTGTGTVVQVQVSPIPLVV